MLVNTGFKLGTALFVFLDVRLYAFEDYKIKQRLMKNNITGVMQIIPPERHWNHGTRPKL